MRAYDCNGDGAFNVDDYASDPRVSHTAGNDEADSILDGSDLIAAFSDGTDADANGYVDDIAGWDFFDDDNDPYDASSYSSASNHGTGRAEEAGEAGQRRRRRHRRLPECQIVPMRVWDTFVVDTNNFAQAVLYAADNDIEVVEGAVGGLFNSRFARAAFDYAYRHGVFLAIVSSDLNTADHNIPTLYDEAMQVQGTVADVHGLGQNPPQQFIDFFNDLGVPLGTQRADRDLVPQLGHDPVRRARAHRDAGRHRLGRDRPGVRRGRADHLVRAPAGHRARAERDQAAHHDDGRGRRCAENTAGPRRPRPGAGRLGPALRLRPARPRARARADRQSTRTRSRRRR